MPSRTERFTPELIETLTPRETEMLHWLAQGQSEKQIAFTLNLSYHTIHDYVRRLYGKLGIASRSELLGMMISYLLSVASSDYAGPPLARDAILHVLKTGRRLDAERSGRSIAGRTAMKRWHDPS